ncbi:beta-lactamase family protein [Hymenobacter coccineus]|uniref:beta-lactamase family protein n=1 Tax=Hymenobacter coccineus TaxID=1908235 RepID=UPI0021CDA6E7|nr:beta-lactamase family protein [Hymenobacter coccineus]
MPLSPAPSPYTTHFAAYGLGWFLRDVRGYQEVWHTGGTTGMVSKVTLLPELHLGIVVLTNQRSRDAYTAVTNQIEDYYLGLRGRDRVQELVAPAAAPAAATPRPKPPRGSRWPRPNKRRPSGRIIRLTWAATAMPGSGT